MKSKLTIFFAGVLALSLTACQSSARRQIISARVLSKGTVPGALNKPGEAPAHRVQLWSSDNPQHGCDVTVAYHGTDQVEAYLEYVSPADPARSSAAAPSVARTDTTNSSHLIAWPLAESPNPYSSRRAGVAEATITLQNVTEVRLVCGDSTHPQPGECSYAIAAIDCSRTAAQVYTARAPGNSLARTAVPCCTGRQVLWTAPKTGTKVKSCSVTALLRGSKLCPARVWTSDTHGNTSGFQFAGEQPTFVTFHNTAKIEFECGSPIDKAGGECSLEILQTECDK